MLQSSRKSKETCCSPRLIGVACIEQSSLPGVQPVQVTVSLGATLARHEDSMASVIKRADQLMYVSKQAGQNHVTTDL